MSWKTSCKDCGTPEMLWNLMNILTEHEKGGFLLRECRKALVWGREGPVAHWGKTKGTTYCYHHAHCTVNDRVPYLCWADCARHCAVLFLVTQSCPTLCDPMDCSPPGSSVLGHTEVDCHALLQGIFPTQGLSPDLHIAGELVTIWVTREAWARHYSSINPT